MANIYTFNPANQEEGFDKNNSNYQLASVAFVIYFIKKLADILEDHINDSSAHQSHSMREKLNIDTSESTDIQDLELETKINIPAAKDIDTDSMHRFISDAQLNILKSKPSIIDIQNLIMDLRNEFKTSINTVYADILNNPDFFKKLKDISYLIKNNSELNSIGSKTLEENLEKHINSAFHLNNNDRKALNLLIGFIEKGCADWNATEDKPNYIRNKPHTLPANGGNADTIEGFSVDDIINRQHEEYVFAVEDNNNSSLSIHYADEVLGPNEDISDCINNIRFDEHKGLWCFKTGKYYFKDLDFTMEFNDPNYGYTIKGANNHNTIFNGNNAIIASRVTIENISFSNTIINIGSLCTLNNIYFINCEIQFNTCNEATIINCIFENCKISFKGACTNTIITGNRFKNSGYPKYYNNTNIINNNLFY